MTGVGFESWRRGGLPRDCWYLGSGRARLPAPLFTAVGTGSPNHQLDSTCYSIAADLWTSIYSVPASTSLLANIPFHRQRNFCALRRLDIQTRFAAHVLPFLDQSSRWLCALPRPSYSNDEPLLSLADFPPWTHLRAPNCAIATEQAPTIDHFSAEPTTSSP